MALHLLSQMPSIGLVPDIVSMSTAISACEQGGDWIMALHLLEQMPTLAVG